MSIITESDGTTKGGASRTERRRLRSYRGHIYGETWDEVTAQAYEGAVAEYRELRGRADRAARAGLAEADAADLEAVEPAYQMAYKLGRDSDMEELRPVMEVARDELLRRRRSDAEARQRSAARDSDLLRAARMASDLADLLASVATDAAPLPDAGPALETRDVALMDDASLGRAAAELAAELRRGEAAVKKYEGEAAALKAGIPTKLFVEAARLASGMSGRWRESTEAVRAELDRVDAERRRREDEARKESDPMAAVKALEARLDALEAR